MLARISFLRVASLAYAVAAFSFSACLAAPSGITPSSEGTASYTEGETAADSLAISARRAYCQPGGSADDISIRIMLVVDTSESMEVTDPGNGRLEASLRLIDTFPAGNDTKFSLVTFDDYPMPVTVDAHGEGIFTGNRDTLKAAAPLLARADGFTNFVGALGLALGIIHDDIAATTAATQQTGQLASPFYFVAFLSDGLPRERLGPQDPASILSAVDDLVDLSAPALGAALLTAFLGMGPGIPADTAKALLEDMAEAGKGPFAHRAFVEFPNGDAIDFTAWCNQL